MPFKQAYIFGCGAQGRVVLDILKVQYPGKTFFFVDENKEMIGKIINDAKVISVDEMFSQKEEIFLHIALGNPKIKQQVAARFHKPGLRFLSAIHPSAVKAPSAFIADGCMVGAGAIVNTQATIGRFCIINTGAIIEHDCQVKDYANISPGAKLGGRAIVHSGSFISTGAIIMARVEIGENTIIGMGSIVTRNVGANILAFGAPAKQRETVDASFNWNRVL